MNANSERSAGEPRVLIVEDDPSVQALLRRVVRQEGYECLDASSVTGALGVMQDHDVDVVISDLELGDLTGVDLLQSLRKRHLDQPLILLTGRPTLESATAAIEHGVYRYLIKPFEPADLGQLLRDAVRARALSVARDPFGARDALQRRFDAAMREAWVAVQPILHVGSQRLIGYECLLRSRCRDLPHPGAIIEAAEKLGALHELGRRVRSLAAEIVARAPDAAFYVNLHPADLADPDLLDPEAPLSRVAGRVVLELTERSPLEGVDQLPVKLAALRALGFRLAVDDLGAGYAGLSYFAAVRPEVVKLDMSLVRGIDGDEVRQRVVRSMSDLAGSLRIEVIGEGVETIEERDTLIGLGCTHLQGYLFARPSAPFPEAGWGPARAG